MRYAILLIAVLLQQGVHDAFSTPDHFHSISNVVNWDLAGYQGAIASRLARGNRGNSRHTERRPRRTGTTQPTVAATSETAQPKGWDSRGARYSGVGQSVHGSTSKTQRKKTTRPVRDVKYDEPPVVPEGNYGVLISANHCIHCTRMLPIVQELRDKGYKVYIYNSSKYPKIKSQLNALDEDARAIGSGAPWFIIRSGGKTTKVFRGYRSLESLLPHMKKPEPAPSEPDYTL